jgi:CheY-like chemotaxis protein
LPTRRRTLLIADDSPTVQKVVSLTFGDEGFHVITVGTGAQALAELEREVPDVLLADVHMPAPGGYELCARIKRDERTRNLPVVLLVGSFEPFDEAEARRSGADEVLTKPFQSIRDLVNKVGGLLGSQPDAPHADERTDDAPTQETRRADAPAMHATEATSVSTTNAMNEATNDSPRVASSTDEGAQAHAATRAYADFDMDDADIETVPATEFAARQPAQPAETFAEDAVDSFAIAAAANGAHSQPRGFEARAAAAAAADDTLLELGDIDAHAARASAPDDDDFVLDFNDDAISHAPQRLAADELASENNPAYNEPPRGAYAFDESTHVGSSQDASAYQESGYQESGYQESAYVEPDYSEPNFSEDAPSAVEMQSAGSVSMAEPSAVWDAAQEFAVSPDAVTEPVEAPAWEEPEVRAMTFDEGEAQIGVDDEDAHVAGDTNAQDAAATASTMSDARDANSQSTAQGVGAQLSSESVDAIARRVVELLSDRVVREIAWEVVPDLAERLIRQRLEEDRTRQ